MQRADIEQHLAQAEGHVSEGAAIVERQRDLIARLESKGIDTADACRLLSQFEEVQALHVADRDRLRRELASLSKRGT